MYDSMRIMFKDGSDFVVSYERDMIKSFGIASNGLVLMNKDGGWVYWFNLDDIRYFYQII